MVTHDRWSCRDTPHWELA